MMIPAIFNKRLSRSFLGAALLVGVVPAFARAQLLPLVNGSFESPTTNFVTQIVDGWTVDGPPDTAVAGIFNNNSTAPGNPAHFTNALGDQLAFIGTETGNELTQMIPAVFESSVGYTLSAGVAVSYTLAPKPADAVRLRLFYLDMAGHRHYIASSIVANSAENGLRADEVKYFSAHAAPFQPADPAVGQPVGVELSTIGAIGRYFDLENVTVLANRPAEWILNGDGTWSDAHNWSGSLVPNGPGHIALLASALQSGHSTISLGGDHTVGTLRFDNPTNSYTIAVPGTLRLDEFQLPASITVAAGTHFITAPIAPAGDVKISVADAANLTLTDGMTLDGTVNKEGGGRLSLRHIRAGGMTIISGTVGIVSDGGQAGASIVNSLSIHPGAALDLADNLLVVRSQSLDQITPLLASGRNGGTWDGPGIQTSSAEFGGLTGLAAVVNDFGLILLDGLAIETNDILIKYTWNGDTDLNGIVDADDYFQIDSGFANGASGWRHGDFDYSGAVDADDYFLIDSAFAGQTSILAAASSAVPEPGWTGFTLVFATVGMRRRVWGGS